MGQYGNTSVGENFRRTFRTIGPYGFPLEKVWTNDWSICQGPPNRGVSNGGFSRSGLVLPFFVLFVLAGTFPIFLGFPDLLGDAPGIFPDFRFVLFLFLGLFRAPTRNSPERVCDTIWTFPKKSGKPPGLETPRFSFSQFVIRIANRKSLAI